MDSMIKFYKDCEDNSWSQSQQLPIPQSMKNSVRQLSLIEGLKMPVVCDCMFDSVRDENGEVLF